MNFNILTYDGSTINIQGGPDLAEFCKQLNNPGLLTLSLGGEVLSKDLFKIVIPEGELTGEYEVYTKDGAVYLTDIESYNADEISAQTNTIHGPFILIGSVLIQRANIKRIKLATVPTT
ncbi:hypothetical protein MKY29_12790 [Psychrobacillus sp. FSL K6-2365]|uniref:hypothetical protein n=1 Tax=Psychrobacillus sp. FSL K6-2365 TaxID=2921546 RepID=UPI0030FCFCF7